MPRLCNERASSSMFHVYAAGLLAVALVRRNWWLLAFVLLVHTASDIIAGLSGDTLHDSALLSGFEIRLSDLFR